MSSEQGQSTAEFALVIPIVLMVAWAVFAFGLAYGRLLDLQSAAREGARRASLAHNDVHAVAATRVAVDRATALNDDADVTQTVTPTPSPTWQHGDTVTVRLSTPTTIRIIGLPVWSGTLTAKAEARVE